MFLISILLTHKHPYFVNPLIPMWLTHKTGYVSERAVAGRLQLRLYGTVYRPALHLRRTCCAR